MPLIVLRFGAVLPYDGGGRYSRRGAGWGRVAAAGSGLGLFLVGR
jgi:hypothetical protein